jgi:glycosyltransferase involved in cell wall biosynthesis
LVVGKPKPGGETEQLMASLGIADKVQFVTGISTEEMVAKYAEASMAVVPSIYEGFGLPAGEAMACEVPVISTNGGALPEVVGEAGIIVPTADDKAIADAIETLLNDPDKREQLGKAGRERILERFCWKVCAQEMTQYYQNILAEYANC